MGDMLHTDLDALRILAARVRNEADTITAIDPVALIAEAAGAMPNSAIGAAASGAGAPLRTLLHHMAGRLETMAATTESGTRTYEEADHAYRTQLDNYLTGTA
ncbi:hypothetical protein [Nocardia inohanensis]|uniref:hypothetical protein n=1 Tax=Nocardia inohanensis TaxID=209246 RepID=UPI000A011F4C|nr:hypothetical protein [Nocardia inohanensis]